MDEIITLDYGSGGRKTSQLIEEMILPVLSNEALAQLGDGAILQGHEKLVFSTDSFVVSPCFFPGGNIGKLSVCGTVNDVAMCGGEPKYLSLSLIIEEGMKIADLQKIIDAIGRTARDAGVQIVTGDTKVVERGKGDGIYINTAGIGFLRHDGLTPDNIRIGDKVILSGFMGDHGTAVMLAREDDLLETPILSDCAPLHRLAASLRPFGSDVRVLRDPTRGGVATTLNEFTEGRSFSIELEEKRLPVRPSVAAACEILGLDPLYCANEGKMLAVVAPEQAEAALAAMRQCPEGKDAAIIGTVCNDHPGRVVLKTAFGGTRVLAKLTGAQLPRIC
ncbi:MAG: hydrogenase expression/formation protein HypE [Clostridiales bacterium]|nr:hydrogenase expression/formation protein HypE [Candidatus Cacconaster stercorequi]